MPSSVQHPFGIAVLLGKPLHSTSVVAEVVERLHHRFPTILLHHPGDRFDIPDAVSCSNLIIQRGLSHQALSAAQQLEDAGVRCCNRISATLACSSRAGMMSLLTNAGLPVPSTQAVLTWREVVDVAQHRPVVVKRETADVGRGAHVMVGADGHLPSKAPFPGPYVVQEFIQADEANVYKLYVAGKEVRGLVKPCLQAHHGTVEVRDLEVDTALWSLAHRTGDAVGLDIFGVDVLIGKDGPVLIDVNPFPGFRGVSDAARLIANHIATVAPRAT